MTAAHSLPTPEPTPAKVVGPKHAAPKVSRFTRPVAALRNAQATVTAPLTKNGRAAKQLRRALDDQSITPATVKAMRRDVKDAEVRTIMHKGEEARLFSIKVPGDIAVDSKGEATQTFRTIVGKVGGTTGKLGETLHDAFDASIWVQLFESESQRTRRVNVQAVAQTLVLAASLASRFAKAAAK